VDQTKHRSQTNVTHTPLLPPPVQQEVPALPFDTSFWERKLPSVGGLLKLVGVSSFLSVAAAAGLLAYKKGLLPRS